MIDEREAPSAPHDATIGLELGSYGLMDAPRAPGGSRRIAVLRSGLGLLLVLALLSGCGGSTHLRTRTSHAAGLPAPAGWGGPVICGSGNRDCRQDGHPVVLPRNTGIGGPRPPADPNVGNISCTAMVCSQHGHPVAEPTNGAVCGGHKEWVQSYNNSVVLKNHQEYVLPPFAFTCEPYPRGY